MTVFYLLLFLIAPLAFVSLVSAHPSNQAPLNEKADVDPIIGIDLGTTYSCVGVMQNGKVEIIANDQGNRITPSYVAFDGNERLVGDAAKKQFAANPRNTIFDVKRLIGRTWSDEGVQTDKEHFPFAVRNQKGKPVVSVDVAGKDRVFTPEEISAMVLGKMRVTAEAHLGRKVHSAVVTGMC